MIVLEVSRFYVRESSEHSTIAEAAKDALLGLEGGHCWPVSIMDNDQEIWRQDGPWGDCIEKLQELAGHEIWT